MSDYVAIDFETANQYRSSACAIGMARFSADGSIQETYSQLIKPHPDFGRFSRRNIAIHHISPRDVAHAPSWADIYGDVLSFIGSSTLVAHNAGFDRSVFQSLNTTYDHVDPGYQWLCTLKLSRALMPDIANHRLNTLMEFYFPHRSFRHHDASEDAIACALIFSQLCAVDGGLDYSSLMRLASM